MIKEERQPEQKAGLCLIMGEWQEIHLAGQPGAAAMWAQVHVHTCGHPRVRTRVPSQVTADK